MTQAGSYAAGIFGRNDKPIPFQRINETSFSDGSLGAVQLFKRQAGAYRSGSLGSFAQPGAYRAGVLGTTPAQAQAAAVAASRAATMRKKQAGSRGGSSSSSSTLTPQQWWKKQCWAQCNNDFRRIHHSREALQQCQGHCDAVNSTSGLGFLDTVPTWAKYAGGAALVLGVGYFALGKKRKRR